MPTGVPLVEASILDRAAVRAALADFAVEGVIHLAGYKYAGVSVQRPLHTYQQNVTGTLTLLEEMAERGVNRIVYSSSAAVYGAPNTALVSENSPKQPLSPYGESKLIAEWVLRDQAVAAGLAHTSLRYFNVVGSGYPDVFDASPHNLLPLVFRPSRQEKRRRSSAQTTTPPTAPACATTSTYGTWPCPTSLRPSGLRVDCRSNPRTTLAVAQACPWPRSWQPSPRSPASTSVRR